MEYYTLGNTGLRVTRLALGTMTFGNDWGWGADQSASRQIFDAYCDAGGNFFDSADMYTNGRSEEMLGAFIRDAGTRDKAIIANLGALDFELPDELRERLDAVSAVPAPFPYSFFGPELQGMLNGGVTVGDKPKDYYRDKTVRSAGAGVGVSPDASAE